MARDTIQAQEEAVLGGGRKKVFWVVIVVVALIVAVICAFAYHSASTKEREFEEDTKQEMRGTVYSRSNDVSNWFRGTLDPAIRFISFDQLKRFAADMDAVAASVPVLLNSRVEDLTESEQDELANLEFVQANLKQLVAYSDFSFGAMLNSEGAMYIKTDPSAQELSIRQTESIRATARSGQPKYGPTRQDMRGGLLLELYIPVFSPVPNEQGGYNVVSVLYLTLPITNKLNDLFNLDGYASQGYAGHLLQREGGVWQQVAFRQDRLRDIPPVELSEDGGIAFGLRESVQGARKVYSQGSKVTDLDWWVLWEQDYEQAHAPVENRIRGIYEFAGLTSVVLILLLSVIWRWSIGAERSATLAKFQELFKLIDEQKSLLDSINSTISEPISLTNVKGVFLYVNQAFADAFGRDIQSIQGMDTAAVCGFDTAKRLNSSDQHVLMTNESVTTNETIWLQSKRHYFQISKSPLRGGDNSTVLGIVAVYRDVTKLVETEERSRRMVQQTIDALVRTIEQSDPFLGGHSRIMGEVARLISTAMHLASRDVATIETAATLSQIGKMFVPREVLTKPGALTPEEKKIMEQHVNHTLKALERIEFDLPVLEVISQMNERLDGQGYPKGLSEETIGVHARVLAVANAFAAMSRPRSFRPAMEVEKVLGILEKDKGSFDQKVVAVLREVLSTPAGERLVAQAASAKAD
ncbi:MAG: PAS domain-containing protein [Desulfovibrionaceae bacterium]|nr:PAS domain-containing protein [Desulfovibrionaceae bacterium]